MVDNRSAGMIGMPGGINFKSGDISGTAAKTADDRSDRGMDYFMPAGEERKEEENFADRSKLLGASLNSLALLNFVSVFKNKNKKNLFDDEEYINRIHKGKAEASAGMTNPIDSETEKDETKKNKPKRTKTKSSGKVRNTKKKNDN